MLNKVITHAQALGLNKFQIDTIITADDKWELFLATSKLQTVIDKIIFPTNLPNLRVVDEALLRPGRAFKVIEFKRLSYDEANTARAAINLPNIVSKDTTDTYTLAEALNYTEGISVPTTTRLGF